MLAVDADITDVSPDPRTSAVDTIEIVFTEEVTGFDIGDLMLTEAGDPSTNLLDGSGASLSTSDNTTFDLNGSLGSLNTADGTYTLTLVAAGSDIEAVSDQEGLTGDASDTWTIDNANPTVNIVDINPDPRITNVGLISIQFSEPVTGFDQTDLFLELDNSGVNLLTPTQTLTTTDSQNYTLAFTGSITSTNGVYLLTLDAASAGITDLVGNPLTQGDFDEWTKAPAGTDLIPPTADIIDVVPDPTSNRVTSLTIEFDEPVTGFDVGDLSLTLDGGSNLLTGGESLTSTDMQTYTLSGIDNATFAVGTFNLTLTAQGSGILDFAQNPMLEDATEEWTQTGVDLNNPTVGIPNVSPDPQLFGLFSSPINFSEPVVGFGLEDLVLRRNGSSNNLLDGSAAELTTANGQNFVLRNIRQITSTAGQYTLSVVAQGSGIEDLEGNPLLGGAAETWNQIDFVFGDTDPPTINILSIDPSPTSEPVTSLQFEFSEAVLGFDVSDISLAKSGSLLGNLLSGNETLSSSDNKLFTLSGIDTLTATNGRYIVAVNAFGSGITDGVGNFLANSDAEDWVQANIPLDVTPPTADIFDVSPDPRDVPVDSIIVTFDEPVTGVDLGDFNLDLANDGRGDLLTDPSFTDEVTLTRLNSVTWEISGLATRTVENGRYNLRLDAASTGIQDLSGNALAEKVNDVWDMAGPDNISPRVDILDVEDPRTTPVESLTVVFTEPVIGFDVSDLNLDLAGDGRGNLLTDPLFSEDPVTLTQIDDVTWTVDGLSSRTMVPGNYNFRVSAESSGITDLVGNPLVRKANELWELMEVDLTAPTVDITDLSVNPRTTPVDAIEIVFSEQVTGFDLSDLNLDRANDGLSNLLTEASFTDPLVLTQVDDVTYLLEGLTSRTSADGDYNFRVNGTGTGITDLAGNPLAGKANELWTKLAELPAGEGEGDDDGGEEA